MVTECERCGAEDEKLYPFWEWMVCFECREILRENDRINARESELEDRRLWQVQKRIKDTG